jgi:hypothetical protein
MTLRELRAALETMDLKNPMFTISAHLNGGHSGMVNSLSVFRSRIQALAEIPFFQSEKEAIFNSFLFQTVSDQLVHDLQELQKYLVISESIRLGAKALKDAIDAVLPPPDETTVVVKLPDAQDLETIIGYLTSLQRSLSQNVINDKIGGQVSVKSWQSGSLWLDIYLGTSAAVTLVGGMLWSAAVVRKKQHEARVMENIADSLKIKNEMLEQLRKGADSQIQLLIESEARALAVHSFEDGDNHEQIERLKLGIKDFAELIDKGAQIHPSLLAPEKVQNLFPNYHQLESIESKQKLLQEKTGAQE